MKSDKKLMASQSQPLRFQPGGFLAISFASFPGAVPHAMILGWCITCQAQGQDFEHLSDVKEDFFLISV